MTAIALALVEVVPAMETGDAAIAGLFKVRIYDDTGNLLPTTAQNGDIAASKRFAFGTEGRNDPGSGNGNVWVDDPLVSPAGGVWVSYDFSWDPNLIQSTNGNSANNAATWHSGAQRVDVVGNSGYSCGSNYESMGLGNVDVYAAEFKFSRTTGEVGDGSCWDLYFGLVPSDDKAIVGATCEYPVATGKIDNLVGVNVQGDGDGVRSAARGWIDGGAGTAVSIDVGRVYTVKINLVDGI
jgi:hypothetical protein